MVAALSFFIRIFRIRIGGPLLACPLYSLTGIYCPGCGGTRALRLLMQGRILASLVCHPLVLYGAVFFSVFMISHTLEIFTHGKIQGVTYRRIYIKIAVILIVISMLSKNLAWIIGRVDLVKWAEASL